MAQNSPSTWVDGKLLASAVFQDKLKQYAVTSIATPIGTQDRTTFDTAAVTLPELAERMFALIMDLRAVGIIK